MGLKKGTGKSAAPQKAKAKAKATTRFTEDEINYEDIAGDYNKTKGGDFFTVTQPRTKIRVIPFKSEAQGRMKAFEKEAKHFQPTSDTKICDCIGDNCPVCEVVRQIDDENIRKKLRSSEKFIMVVALRDEDDRIVVWRAPYGAWNAIMSIVNNRQDFPDALSLREGLDFIVIKEGSGTGSRYNAQVSPKRTAVKIEVPVPDVTALLARRKPNDLEEIAKKMRKQYGV